MRTAFIAILALIIEIMLILFVYLNGNGSIPLHMFFYFEVFILFLLAWFILKRFKEKGKFAKHIPMFIIVTGMIFRATLISANTTTSPDVYRYIWEGKITYNGYNPYLIHPDSSVVAHLKTKDWPKVGWRQIPGLYPPFAEGVYVLSYIISGDNLLGLKLIYLVFDLLTMIILLKFLKLKNRSPEEIILYAWLPLPLFEYFVNGHIDIAGIFTLIGFLYFFEKGKIKTSAVFFALSFLSKFYPAVLMLLIFRKAGLKNSLWFFGIFAAIIIIAYIPFYSGNFGFADQLMRYIQNWEFNGSLFNLFKALFYNNSETARKICFSLLALSILGISLTVKDFMKGAFLCLIAVVVFGTTVYPWYLGWSAVVNPLFGFSSMIYLYFSSNLSNFTPMGKVWKEYRIVLIIEYVPFFLLLFYNLRSVFFLPEKENYDSKQYDS